ncbi:hypothetical protein KCP69_08105 [Salmonella enterica subsp. enterica]|nr:hypothetical protein KCP69_08105 [Salmonella enterica subsp. enterica]
MNDIINIANTAVGNFCGDDNSDKRWDVIRRKWSFLNFGLCRRHRKLFERLLPEEKGGKFIIIIRGVNISEEYIKLSGHIKYNLRK